MRLSILPTSLHLEVEGPKEEDPEVKDLGRPMGILAKEDLLLTQPIPTSYLGQGQLPKQ